MQYPALRHGSPRARRVSARRPARGAVAVAFLAAFALLFGFCGLALDMGRLFVIRAELQNAADACALAAVGALNGGSDALVRGEAQGMLVGSRNPVDFQRRTITFTANASVTFAASVAGPFRSAGVIGSTSGTSQRAARCVVELADVQPIAMRVLNLIPGTNVGSSTVDAVAVATLAPSRSTCAIPVGVCPNPKPVAGADASGWARGQWIKGISDSSETGNFRWLKFETAATVPDMDVLLRGTGQCNTAHDSTVASGSTLFTRPGFISSLSTAYNSRFGMYRGADSPSNGAPDRTGFAYWPDSWPAGSNAYGDYLAKRLTGVPVQTSFQRSGYKSLTSASHLSLGVDRRLAVAPIIDCNALSGGRTTQATNWACLFLLHPVRNGEGGWPIKDGFMRLEYRGLASDPASGCVANGGSVGNVGTDGPAVPALAR